MGITVDGRGVRHSQWDEGKSVIAFRPPVIDPVARVPHSLYYGQNQAMRIEQ